MHTRSLISAFIIRLLESIISKLAILCDTFNSSETALLSFFSYAMHACIYVHVYVRFPTLNKICIVLYCSYYRSFISMFNISVICSEGHM